MEKQTPICPYCSSYEVRRDATAVWCNETQDWVLLAIYDNGWCSDCEEDIKQMKWIPISSV